jgi:transcriptional regulator with XRE-family HTH domain
VAAFALYRNHCGVPHLSRNRQHRALVALGRAIRELRSAKKISQEELADLAGVDRSHVGRVERGDNNVALLTLVRIADALDTTVTRLVQRAGL